MMREGEAIGAVTVTREAPGEFSPRQIELLHTFADQAVIAIGNTRLFEAEQASKLQLQESLEYQTAMGEVLGVIARAPGDLQQVLDAVAESAARVCRATEVRVFRLEGNKLRRAAMVGRLRASDYGVSPDLPLSRGSVSGRAILDRRSIHVTDLAAEIESEYPDRAVLHKAIRHCTILTTPLVRDRQAIGAIMMLRLEVAPFSEKQIKLLETFADQAVIAIENSRLFEAEQASKRELTEALEQQTATADVLKVISRSALDVQKVLDALVESAARLCDAYDAAIFQLVGDGLRLMARHGQFRHPVMSAPVGELTVPLVRGSMMARAVIVRRTIHVSDILTEADEYPVSRSRALQTGFRTALAVPLVRAGEAIGVIYIWQSEVRPFTERQIELVNTFADQAVIAIENTRLFDEVQARTAELTQSLEYQTAIGEVLNAISRSPSQLQPVLDTIVATAQRLCQSDDAYIYKLDEGLYHLAAANDSQAGRLEYLRNNPIAPNRGSLTGRVAFEGRSIQIEDVLADHEYTFSMSGLAAGYRTNLGVPLLRDEATIGVIILTRYVVQPFTEKQVELVTTFADQAVIAIENTRLFEEVQARTRELAKTVEDLEIASQHKNQFVANMSHELRTPLAAILGYAELIEEGFYEPQGPKSLDALTRIRSNGKHLLGLINTVLDIAKIESGQFTLNMTEYAIDSVVETVRSATESLAQNKNLALKTEVAKSLPIGLGDEQRLTQVLLNLVGNAIKFTDAGEVRVTAKAVNGHFAVSVADTGPGIPEQEQMRIFDQFHQVDGSLTKAKGGTGLGLAIAKQIVEMHGGRIWVESTLGKGSTFQIEMPTRAEFRKLVP